MITGTSDLPGITTLVPLSLSACADAAPRMHRDRTRTARTRVGMNGRMNGPSAGKLGRSLGTAVGRMVNPARESSDNVNRPLTARPARGARLGNGAGGADPGSCLDDPASRPPEGSDTLRGSAPMSAAQN